MGSWTQPLCRQCWNRENPDRPATVGVQGNWERCCECGERSTSGIYVRRDPSTVPFPDDSDG